MKFLLFTVFDFPHSGGMSTHMGLMRKGLTDRQNEVDTLSVSNLSILMRKIVLSLPCKLLNLINKDLGTLWVYGFTEVMLSILFFFSILFRQKYNVINCQDILAARIAIRFQRIFNYKIYLTAHGYFVLQAASDGCLNKDGFVGKLYLRFEKNVYSHPKVESIITVDSRIKQYIVDMAGHQGVYSKTTILKNFIDIDAFKQNGLDGGWLRGKWNLPKEKFIMLSTRRLVPKNGVVYPILALNELRGTKEFDNILLVYAGNGQEKSKMEELIKLHKLEDKVVFLGDVNHKEIAELYNVCDVILVPSVNSEGVEEATSISAIEGMACNKVVIASEIGGLKELIKHTYNGLLVKEKDAKDLADAIVTVYSDEANRKLLEINARKTVEEELSLDKRIKEYLDIFSGKKSNITEPR
ncbi:glycosyltransferase family 4 protein [Paenibacillus methanolicus]|uniref:Glycosyltransferase involved in cell wall biosynthesis n=1 Tax=Paenibacillus methanolicus TaxID=582686 RepID=A0A5S5CAL7_9BACL|nr:glycosyltransferase family 4 protein [Paenibacillus methanolicus]TYP75668.1 glycosyltransferase involved in cell wall biosynthesis [Paenibacillus methanolicus]